MGEDDPRNLWSACVTKIEELWDANPAGNAFDRTVTIAKPLRAFLNDSGVLTDKGKKASMEVLAKCMMRDNAIAAPVGFLTNLEKDGFVHFGFAAPAPKPKGRPFRLPIKKGQPPKPQ